MQDGTQPSDLHVRVCYRVGEHARVARVLVRSQGEGNPRPARVNMIPRFWTDLSKKGIEGSDPPLIPLFGTFISADF